MEFHRQDVLATGTMQLAPDVLEEMVRSWGFMKDSEAYKTKMEKIQG